MLLDEILLNSFRGETQDKKSDSGGSGGGMIDPV